MTEQEKKIEAPPESKQAEWYVPRGKKSPVWGHWKINKNAEKGSKNARCFTCAVDKKIFDLTFTSSTSYMLDHVNKAHNGQKLSNSAIASALRIQAEVLPPPLDKTTQKRYEVAIQCMCSSNSFDVCNCSGRWPVFWPTTCGLHLWWRMRAFVSS
jgi:hypothetical protein